jgi:protein-S-isoprenylcysteine O-methyltransferase Ste14
VSARAAFFARWRVRLGYPLAIAVLWLARPTPCSIVIGGLVGALGLWLRAYAAGYLHKQETLTITGPYAHTRNPLYLGSAILALGTGIATHSWVAAVLLLAYFALFYSIVMRREEGELRGHHGATFEVYARAVPLFFPRITPAKMSNVSADSASAFSYAQYRKNHEWQAMLGFVLLLAALLVLWRLRLH